jgi:quinol monooxygenase YgiN
VIQVLTQSEVQDFDAFWRVFNTRGRELRKRHGSLRARVFQVHDNPNGIMVLYDWESREHFLRALEDPEVRMAMQEASLRTPPLFTFLGSVGDFDA